MDELLRELHEQGLDVMPQPSDKTRRIIGDGKATTVQRYAPTVLPDSSSVGDYLPERQRLHKDILTRLLAGKTPETDKTGTLVQRQAVFTAGGTASGKSTLLDEKPEELDLPDESHSIHIDPDKIKEMLPEYQKLKEADDHFAAQAVHRESGDLADAAIKQAMRAGLHVIIDGTGNHKSGMFANQLTRMANAGYAVDVVYADRPVMDAMRETVTRALGDGRYVPSGVVRQIHKSVSENFSEIASLPFVRSIRVYRDQQLIAQGGSGRVEPVNPEAFTEFLMKANDVI
jgi:predicted kinase